MDSRSLELYSQPLLSITNCVTIKLNQQNYILWKSQFQSFLSGKGLLGFVTGTLKPPPATMTVPTTDGRATEVVPSLDFQSWERSDQVVKAWLLGSFSEEILSIVVDANTSQEVWGTLARHFNRVTSSRLFGLQRKLQSVVKSDKTMTDYLKEIKDMCSQLASIGNPVTEKIKIFAAGTDDDR